MAEGEPAAKKARTEQEDAAEGGDGEDDPEHEIFYISEKTLKVLKEKLAEGKEITTEDVGDLTKPGNLPDDEMMVPVDMRAVEDDYDDVDQMIEKLGPKGAAEIFVKARERFEQDKTQPEDERPQPKTAKEWRDFINEDLLGFEEGEEEEAYHEDPEEEIEDGEEDGEGGEGGE